MKSPVSPTRNPRLGESGSREPFKVLELRGDSTNEVSPAMMQGIPYRAFYFIDLLPAFPHLIPTRVVRLPICHISQESQKLQYAKSTSGKAKTELQASWLHTPVSEGQWYKGNLPLWPPNITSPSPSFPFVFSPSHFLTPGASSGAVNHVVDRGGHKTRLTNQSPSSALRGLLGRDSFVVFSWAASSKAHVKSKASGNCLWLPGK